MLRRWEYSFSTVFHLVYYCNTLHVIPASDQLRSFRECLSRQMQMDLVFRISSKVKRIGEMHSMKRTMNPMLCKFISRMSGKITRERVNTTTRHSSYIIRNFRYIISSYSSYIFKLFFFGGYIFPAEDHFPCSMQLAWYLAWTASFFLGRCC